MRWFDKLRQLKIGLVVAAIAFAIASLIVSHILIQDLSKQENNNMAIWAEAMKSLANADENSDLGLVLKVINGNNYIPVIVTDARGNLITSRNVHLNKRERADSLTYLKKEAAHMMQKGRYFRVSLTNNDQAKDYIIVSYDDSTMLKRLASFPYVQLGVVTLFAVIAVIAILATKRAEQNRVWVGLSKETAHQLGTPISSLIAWVEVLQESHPDDTLIPEMRNDVERLQLIAQRFSKIGSVPDLQRADIGQVVQRTVDYMTKRTSARVIFRNEVPLNTYFSPLCVPLFAWVVENLCKNAIDAMACRGCITLKATSSYGINILEISDTGKGIEKKNFKNIFRPGFTTKERGWGLGLSLAKRIICDYHHARIYVKSSEINVGTTFRIEIRQS